MVKKQEFCDVQFWLAIIDAGLGDEVSRLIVEVPKAPQLVKMVVETEGKKYIFKNYGSHIDCLIVGVVIKTLFRLLK